MIFEILFILFLNSMTFFFLLMKKKKRDFYTRRLPPGPGKLPIIGNLHQLGKLPHRSLQSFSKTYGDLMFLQLGSVPTLVVSSPDRAREIFKEHDLVFSGRPPLYAFRRFTYNLCSISTAPYGDYWREVRKIMVLGLMTAKRVESFGRIRVQEVAFMIKHIASTVPGLVDLSSLAFSVSHSVVCRVAFGTMNDPEKSSKFQEIFHEMQQLASELNLADCFPGMAWVNRINGVDNRINKNLQKLDAFFNKVIEEHRDRMGAESDNEDIVDILLRIQKDPHQTINLTDEQLKAILIDVLIAGTDTAAATIVWTIAELMRNPTAKEKAQQEVRKVANGKTKVEETDLPKLTYLKLVIKESLRLHPPVPLLLPRETLERCTIGNKYEIPAKTRVFFNAAAMSTDPGYWKNPETFWPERFVNSQVDFKGQHFELLPFGAGRRGCPGINFAIPLVELALANLLFCFDWGLPKGLLGEDIDMGEAFGIVVHKKTPLCLLALPVNE